MCKVYGYARISRKTQNIERQIRNIQQFCPDAVIYQEAYTGRQINRPVFDRLIRKAEKGEVTTIIFDSVSRMSRDAAEGVKMYHHLHDLGVNLVFLKERHIDTASYTDALAKAEIDVELSDTESDEGRLVSDIVNALNRFIKAKVDADIYKAFEQSEKEVTDLRERTSEGLDTAKRNGKRVGLSKGEKLTTKKSIIAKQIIVKQSRDFNGTLNDADTMKLAGISRNTFYRYKAQLMTERNS